MLDHISSLEVEQYIQNKQTNKLMQDSSQDEKHLSDKPLTKDCFYTGSTAQPVVTAMLDYGKALAGGMFSLVIFLG